MIASDLIDLNLSTSRAGPHAVDPFASVDALLEAQVLSVRADTLTSRIGILFEMRLALHLVDANAAVLVASGLRQIEWAAEARLTSRTAWTVIGSKLKRRGGNLRFELVCYPHAQLSVTALELAFYSCEVTDITEEIPDYVADGATAINAALPQWHSTVDVVRQTTLSTNE